MVLWFLTGHHDRVRRPAGRCRPPPAAPSAPKSLFESDTITPDPGGLRAKLADHGIALGVLYTGRGFRQPRRRLPAGHGLATGPADPFAGH